MRNKKHLPFVTFFFVITSYFIFSSSGEKKDSSGNPNKTENFAPHPEDLSRATEYYFSLRKNIQTGKTETDDILKAREQIRLPELQKSGSFNMQWEERGPSSRGGRTRAILVDRNNSNRVFAGHVSGGLFISNDAGTSWTPVDDPFENLIVSSLEQSPDGSFWMGTGSDFEVPGTTPGILFPGNGLYHSPDGTKGSWTRVVGPVLPNNPFDTIPDTTVITKPWVSINRIAFNPGNSNEIYVAMNKGLRVSTDGGQSWINPIYLGNFSCTGPLQQSIAHDVEVTSDGRLFVSLNGILYYSDAAAVCSSWVKIPTTVIPQGLRTEIAISPSNPNYVYVCVVDNDGNFQGVYKSVDKGLTWTQILLPVQGSFTPMTYPGFSYGQGFYDLALEVAPNNPDKIFIGGIELWRYDGNLTKIANENNGSAPYYVHANKHIFAFDPNNPDKMYIGTDGGVFKSDDQGGTFSIANEGYNVSQAYTIAFGNPSSPADKAVVMCGTQGDGTLAMPYSGFDPLNGQKVLSGNGFSCEISNITGAMFGSRYSVQLFRSPGIGNNFSSIGSSYLTESIFKTEFRLWESEGDSGTRSLLAVGISSSQGGIAITRYALDFGVDVDSTWETLNFIAGTPSCLEFSPDGSHLFAGVNGLGVYRISGLQSDTTSSVVITKIFNTARNVTGVSVSQKNPDNLVVTLGNYGATDHVYLSTNALTDSTSTGNGNFVNVSGNLPYMPIYDAEFLLDSSKVLLGTEFGIFGTGDIFANPVLWACENNGEFPSVPTYEIRQQKYLGSNNYRVIYVATFGRGTWESGTFSTVIEENMEIKILSGLHIYPNPVNVECGVIEFNLKKSSFVEINLFDINGKIIKSMTGQSFIAGMNRIQFQIENFSAGTYFVCVETEYDSKVEKFMVVD